MAKAAVESAPLTVESASGPVVEAPNIVGESIAERFPMQRPTHDVAEDDFTGDEGDEDLEAQDQGEEHEVEQEEEDEQPRDDQGRFKSKGQTLRDRLAAEARERIAAQQRAERLEYMLAQNQALMAKQMGLEPEQPQQPEYGPPNPDNYPAGQFDPKFIEDSTNFRINQALEQREIVEAQRRTQSALLQAEAQFAQAVPDYIEAKQALMENPAIAHNPIIGQAVVSSNRPMELAYILGKNPNVANNIANMPPAAALMALGRVEAIIEASLHQGAQQQAPQQAKQPPAPIKPIRGQTVPSNSEVGQAKTYAEFVAIREAQEKKRFGR